MLKEEEKKNVKNVKDEEPKKPGTKKKDDLDIDAFNALDDNFDFEDDFDDVGVDDISDEDEEIFDNDYEIAEDDEEESLDIRDIFERYFDIIGNDDNSITICLKGHHDDDKTTCITTNPLSDDEYDAIKDMIQFENDEDGEESLENHINGSRLREENYYDYPLTKEERERDRCAKKAFNKSYWLLTPREREAVEDAVVNNKPITMSPDSSHPYAYIRAAIRYFTNPKNLTADKKQEWEERWLRFADTERWTREKRAGIKFGKSFWALTPEEKAEIEDDFRKDTIKLSDNDEDWDYLFEGTNRGKDNCKHCGGFFYFKA